MVTTESLCLQGTWNKRPVAHKMSFIVCHRILILKLTTTTITEGAHSCALVSLILH